MHSAYARHVRLLVVGFVALLASPAVAGTFDVKSTDIAKGETEVSVNTSYFSGYPINAELLRHSSEIGIGYGFTDWWKAGLKIGFDKPIGADFQASTAGVEAQFLLRKFEANSLGIGWYTGVDFRIADDATNTLTFGPIFQFGSEKTSFTVNPFLARTFGRNHEEGMAFTYAWQAKQELREGLAFGIEGYGSVPNIGNSPSLDFQEHRIGPVLYFERSLARSNAAAPKSMSIKDVKSAEADKGPDGPKLNIEAGVLFGLTDGTQDVTYKLKGAITF
jgi:hypothetical protein